MAETGYSYAASGYDNGESADANNIFTGDLKGVNPASTANSGKDEVTTPTNTLVTTNYGFVLPAFTEVVGIKVRIGRRVGFTNTLGKQDGKTKDDTVRLVIGGSISGENKASPTPWPTYAVNKSVVTYVEYGGPLDTWGGVTREQVMDSDFGVAIRVSRTKQSGFVELSDIKIVVYYMPSAGVDLNYGGVWVKAEAYANVGGVYKATIPTAKYKGVWRR